MKAVSLFSGAGGFEVGFDMAGIDTVLQAESDPWALEVLKRHWPDVERVTDVRDVREDSPRHERRGRRDLAAGGHGADAQPVRPRQRAPLAGTGNGADGTARGRARGNGNRTRLDPSNGRREARAGLSSDIDLVYGGWPCQGNSVAGKRAGLSDERSGLWHEVRRVLRELRPRWFVGENVPGLLSVNRGLDWLRVLMDLDDLGYGVAWRVVDARWFGVPQRRRRVLVVGCLGNASRAAQVLAVCESCGGHPQKGGGAGQGSAAAAEGSSGEPGAWSTKLANTKSNQAGKFYEEYTPALAHNSPAPAVAGTLGTGRRRWDPEAAWTNRLVEAPDTAATLSAGSHPSSAIPGRHHEDDENLVVDDQEVVTAVTAKWAKGSSGPAGDEFHNMIVADPVTTNEGRTPSNAEGRPQADADKGDQDPLIAFDYRTSGTERSRPVRAGDYTGTLQSGREREAVGNGAGVRRLTPMECERLQGFPDEWTRYTSDGREIADSHRYRLMGNAVATVVAQWLGHRLVVVDTLIRLEEGTWAS